MTTDTPKRKPYGEAFAGVIFKVNEHTLLAQAAPPDVDVLHSGLFVLRYGITYLEKPQYSIVPGLVAVDYGEILAGEEAWHFLFHRSNLYPRADVIGYRNDGVDEMIVVKKLDFMQPVTILAYADAQATTPLAPINAIIASETAGFPAWLLQYGKFYQTLADWQAVQQ
jgi:hypothetical protein